MSDVAVIDYDYFARGECGFADLEEASEKLLAATDADFDRLKKEKWFGRVFDMVTFSQKKNVRLASQINSLARAQSVISELLVRLSERDKKVFSLLERSQKQIEKLAENDIALLNRQRRLESKLIFGFEEVSLSDSGRLVLGGLLSHLVEQYPNPSELQKRYADSTCRYFGVNPRPIKNLHDALAEISDTSERRLLLSCVMEYAYLEKQEHQYPEGVSSVIEEFDLGKKSLDSIRGQINIACKLRGVEGLIRTLNEEGEEPVTDALLSFVPVESSEPVARDVLRIEMPVDVPAGKIRTYRNKIIHLKSHINCAGDLLFENCQLLLNEPGDGLPGGIYLDKGAKIQFVDCDIESFGDREDNLIKGDGNSGKNDVRFTVCRFKNCSKFLDPGYGSVVNFEGCTITNPGPELASSSFGPMRIEKCRFVFSEQPSWFSGHKVIGHVNGLDVEDCRFEYQSNWDFGLFDCDQASFLKCDFVGVQPTGWGSTSIINRFKSIKQCRFHRIGKALYRGEKSEVAGSVFVDCENVFSSCEDVKVSDCQFAECGAIVAGLSSYGVVFDLCYFINSRISDRSDVFRMCADKDRSDSRFSRCVFDGFDGYDPHYLVGIYVGGGSSNTKRIRISDCQFLNIRTKRPDGAVIQQAYESPGFLGSTYTPVSIDRCVGLDKINAGQGKADGVIIRVETSAGEPIGSSLVATDSANWSSTVSLLKQVGSCLGFRPDVDA